MSNTLKTITLGCKVNQYETQYVRESLKRIGYEEALPGELAQLCIVNTCTVTGRSDAKSRQAIRRLARANPGARIVVMGCYAARAAEEVAALPGVVEVVGDKRELPDLLHRLGVVDVPDGISTFAGRHRAFVKVQDGCIMDCSYCIIPKVRPNLVSRPVASILDEVCRLVDAGYREIIFTGIHLGHYGIDFNRGKPKPRWVRLADLVHSIAQLDADFRIRLSSLEAIEITRELIAAMVDHADKVCPHLHVSMQSGSDAVLHRMRRRWGSRRFLDRCQMVREAFDRPALTTDVIVGFPGETDADFESTCEAVCTMGFSKVHIFPFSPREGTAAAEMPNRVPQHVVDQRRSHLASLERTVRRQYFERLAGLTLRVLAESPVTDRPGYVVGTSCRYAPVELLGDESICGQLVDATAGPVVDGRIMAAAPHREPRSTNRDRPDLRTPNYGCRQANVFTGRR